MKLGPVVRAPTVSFEFPAILRNELRFAPVQPSSYLCHNPGLWSPYSRRSRCSLSATSIGIPPFSAGSLSHPVRNLVLLTIAARGDPGHYFVGVEVKICVNRYPGRRWYRAYKRGRVFVGRGRGRQSPRVAEACRGAWKSSSVAMMSSRPTGMKAHTGSGSLKAISQAGQRKTRFSNALGSGRWITPRCWKSVS